MRTISSPRLGIEMKSYCANLCCIPFNSWKGPCRSIRITRRMVVSHAIRMDFSEKINMPWLMTQGEKKRKYDLRWNMMEYSREEASSPYPHPRMCGSSSEAGSYRLGFRNRDREEEAAGGNDPSSDHSLRAIWRLLTMIIVWIPEPGSAYCDQHESITPGYRRGERWIIEKGAYEKIGAKYKTVVLITVGSFKTCDHVRASFSDCVAY